MARKISLRWLKKYRVHFDLRNPPGTEEYERLKTSIKRYGIIEPLKIVVGEEDNLARLLNGHHRLSVAEELGFETVEVEIIKRPYISDRGIKIEGDMYET